MKSRKRTEGGSNETREGNLGEERKQLDRSENEIVEIDVAKYEYRHYRSFLLLLLWRHD